MTQEETLFTGGLTSENIVLDAPEVEYDFQNETGRYHTETTRKTDSGNEDHLKCMQKPASDALTTMMFPRTVGENKERDELLCKQGKLKGTTSHDCSF